MMNQVEIARQIAKFKARRLKTRLAHYSTLVSIFLTLSIFGNGLSMADLVPFLLLLPLPLYFSLQSFKLARLANELKPQVQTLTRLVSSTTPQHFSPLSFLSQKNFSFRLSLALLFLVLFTTLARTRDTHATLTLNQTPQSTYQLP